MAKHRRPPADAPSAPPRPARELLIWSSFGCAVVPLVLLWSGTGWRVALAVAGLIALLAVGCVAALRLTGMTRARDEPPSEGESRADDRHSPDRP